MQRLSGKTWWKTVTLLTMTLAMLFAVNANAITYHTSPDAPALYREYIDYVDLDIIQPEIGTPTPVASPERPASFLHTVITVLHLSSFIFQPPEAA